jgi:predicted MFS family arabinose efflux permease
VIDVLVMKTIPWNWALICHGIAFGMLPPLTMLYFQSLDGSLLDYSLMVAEATLASAVTSLLAGRLLEQNGRARSLIVFSLLSSALLLFGFTQTPYIQVFQILYICLEASNVIMIPASRLLIAESNPIADWSRVFAQHNLIAGLAGTIGLGACSLLLATTGYGSLLLLCVPLVVTSLVLALVMIREPPAYVERWLDRITRPIDEVNALSYQLNSNGGLHQFIRQPTVNMFGFGMGTLIFMIAGSSAFQGLPLYLGTVMSLSMIFLVLMIRSLCGTFSFLLAGKWSQTWRCCVALKAAALARAIVVLLLPIMVLSPLLAPVISAVLLSVIAFSWSLYAVDSNMMTLRHGAGGTPGLLEAVRRVGCIVGGICGGVIPAVCGYNVLFIVSSLCFILAFSVFRKNIS